MIERGGWGSSKLRDVHAVVQSVCDVFHRDASVDVADPIILRFSELHGPRALFERGPNNEHIILVSAKDRLWARLAFQFAHEYCHVFSDHYRVPNMHPFGWMEESICELASLYALQRMGELWRERPPYPNWRAYSDSLATYARRRIDGVQRFGNASDFRFWLDANIVRMRSDPIVRELNNVVAVHLLPYFRRFPEAWQCVTRMNTKLDVSGDLESYFAAWLTVGTPHVTAIANLMNVTIPVAT